MTAVRTLASRALAKLPDRAEGVARRVVARLRYHIERVSPRSRRAIVLPGDGPVVLLDARGQDKSVTISSLAELGRDGPLRVVLAIDDPEVQLYRDLPLAALEYVPREGSNGGGESSASRVDELVRVYRIERIVGPSGHSTGPVDGRRL